MVIPEDAQKRSGSSFLLQWLASFFSGDDYARAATRRVLIEVRGSPPGPYSCGGWAAAGACKVAPCAFTTPCCPPAFQLAVFYVLILVGFLALYLTWRSNAK